MRAEADKLVCPMTGQRPAATLPDMGPDRNCADKDPELWFPPDARTEERNAYLCAGCPYRAGCLEYALAVNEQGVWGGTSHEQRQTIREQLGITAEPVRVGKLAPDDQAVARARQAARDTAA